MEGSTTLTQPGRQATTRVKVAPPGSAGNAALKFLPFKDALLYARSLMRKTKKGWEAWCTSGVRPANIHSHPETVYKHDGWQGYGHWLGTGNDGVKKDKQFLPFK